MFSSHFRPTFEFVSVLRSVSGAFVTIDRFSESGFWSKLSGFGRAPKKVIADSLELIFDIEREGSTMRGETQIFEELKLATTRR